VLGRAANAGPHIDNVRIFISFDLEHDGDLHDRLLQDSVRPNSGFEISAHSEARTLTDPWEDRIRRRICEADEVIVICGEHTDESLRVSAELRIAQEEGRPYFLLWGRRASMCTKPAAAKPADGMYSWTWEILQSQILVTLRHAAHLERSAALALAAQARKGGHVSKATT
jgi:hypothetical protein